MKLVLDYTSVRGLAHILRNVPGDTSAIHASIAYNADDRLIQTALNKRIQLKWWGLFDSENSTRHNLIELALKHKDLVSFHPVKQFFHPKLIFFENYGLYVGSANMTRKALNENIECGVFLDHMTLVENDLIGEVEEYFEYLERFPVITDQDARRYLDYINSKPELKNTRDVEREKREEEFNKLFEHLPYNDSAVVMNEDSKFLKNKVLNKFIVEWRSTVNILLSIMRFFETEEYYPSWVRGQPPKGIMADQFLHAYYYSIINAETEDENSFQACSERHIENKPIRDQRIKQILQWWQSLESAPSKEDEFIHDWTQVNQQYLKPDRILHLTEDELAEVYLHNHAARNHSRQMKKEDLGVPPGTKMSIDECAVKLASYHYNLRNRKGMTILEFYYYVIFNDKEPVEVRINKALSKEYRIPHVGQSLLGEIVGWARPNEYPIRNNRVNKALYALGFDVKLFNK